MHLRLAQAGLHRIWKIPERLIPMTKDEPQNDVEKALQQWADSLDNKTRRQVNEHFSRALELDEDDDDSPA
jgi:hypothetical protein